MLARTSNSVVPSAPPHILTTYDNTGDELAIKDTDFYALEGRVETHEAVCALRYEGINSRLKRMEGIFISGAGAVILLLSGILFKLIGA